MATMDLKRSDRFCKPELLAPAGDLARAKLAIRYGADAVYLGGQSYSLRSRASNFTMEDIEEACRFAKEYGARIHVTVNMIPHEEDFEGLKEYLQKLESYGVTAIIAASPSVHRLAYQYAPKLERHCSTQMSVTNLAAAEYLKNALHLDRVVLARECSMEDIRNIAGNCSIETEAFIHGGMCVNYSGRCTLSNRMTLRDANRGGCAQSCRWNYHLFEDETEITKDHLFTMSSRDLSVSQYMYDLMNAGVASLKIEGRMKTEYYVASIVSGYRHLIDEIYENKAPLSADRMACHRHEIMRGENREACTGFYAGNAGHESLIYYVNNNSHVNHDFLGTVVGFEEDEVKMEVRNTFTVGETLEVLTPGKENRCFTVESIIGSRGDAMEKANHPMEVVTLHIPFAVGMNDIIRRKR